jgi:peptidoglycan/LPS O-acetylase OafA/YrhL
MTSATSEVITESSGSAPRAEPSTRFLDGLRGLAALYVVLHHASAVLHEGWVIQLKSYGRFIPRAPGHLGWANVFRVFHYGRTAVIFFFVLSGFVIHLKYARKLKADPAHARFGWGEYVKRRALRLYPPLILALAITMGCDWLGRRAAWPPFTGLTTYRFAYSPATSDHGAASLLGNLLFVQSAIVPTYGTNGPLWSLTYEWWFYMIYPALWWASRGGAWRASVVTVALGVGAMFLPRDGWWLLPRAVLPALPAWWLGAVLADVYAGRVGLRMAWLTPLALLLPVTFVLKAGVPIEIQQFLIAIAFAGLMACCFWWQRRRPLTALEALKPLGDMSFTLYVIHMPILIAVGGWYMARDPEHRVPTGPGLVVAGVVLVLGMAYVCHLFAERPFLSSRKRARAAAGVSARGALLPAPV